MNNTNIVNESIVSQIFTQGKCRFQFVQLLLISSLFSLSIEAVGHHGATDGGAQQDITTKRIPLSSPVTLDFFFVGTDSFIVTQLDWLTGTGVELLVKPSETRHYPC